MSIEKVFATLTEFLNNPGTCDRHYKRKYKLQYPAEYIWIIKHTHLTEKSPFFELFYAIKHGIVTQPVCKYCNKNTVNYRVGQRRYMDYCSSSCSIMVCHEKSDTAAMKETREATMHKKYGVKNASHREESKQLISKSKTLYWKEYYNNKDFTIGRLSKEQYRHRAQQYAETQYSRFRNQIDPEGLRSKEYHLDHVYSISDGFVNDVPIDVISDVSNLIIISANENLSKNKSSNKTLEQLYEDHKKARD